MVFMEETFSKVRDLVYDVLSNDSEVMTGTKFVCILKTLPRPGTGPGATPNAYYTAAESPTQAGMLKPTIVVLDGGDTPAPNGETIQGIQAFPSVYGYVPTTSKGESMLATLQRKLYFHFPRDRGGWYPLGTGPGVQIQTLERQPLRDGDDFGYQSRWFAVWRVQGTFIRV
jgi:hypothetical protein